MRRVASYLGMLACGFLAMGCENNVTPGEGGGDVGGGDIGGGDIGGGDVGGGTVGECACADAEVSFEIFDPEGLALVDPNSDGETAIELTGSVRALSPGVWEIDTCPPNADCLASIYRLELTVPGLTPEIPEGAFVTLASSWYDFDGIELHQWVEIRNLPTFGGENNPISSGEELLVFANVGIVNGAPFPITLVEHCSDPGADPNGLDLVFVADMQVQADNGPDGGPFTIEAGQIETLSYAAGVDAGDYLITSVSVCSFYEYYRHQYGIARVIAEKL